ncbi:MAG: carbohydrate ABC transporter permease [Dorea sp.]|jgi:multiple sugar transport system permease protein|nr:carbohydrate ABC transporter permease [Dorea sp.]
MTSRRKTWQTILLYVFIVVLCVVILYPYFVMFITALKDNKEMYAVDHILPNIWQWSNFADIWKAAPVFKYLINSMIIAGGATVLAILCGIPAAYALARMRFKGKGIFMGAVIMSQMFSPVVLLVGIYRMMVNINLNNTILGLILLNAAFNQAFAIWLLRGTFMGISPEMEQAAKIDGCGTVKALVRVLLPMALPGIITTLIFVFINAWNEYTIALTLISTDIFKPITVGINVFYGFNFIQWQYLFATSLFATIPVVILFLIIEKHLVAGLTSGGVKG